MGEMSSIMQNMKAQYNSDMAWMQSVVESTEQHAMMLDVHHEALKQHSGEIISYKEELKQNDAQLKICVLENDDALKKILNDKDTIMTANLKMSEDKIEVLMQEAMRLQGLIDESHISVTQQHDKFDEKINVLGQAAGNVQAFEENAQRLKNVEQQVNFVKGAVQTMEGRVADVSDRQQQMHLVQQHLGQQQQHQQAATAAQPRVDPMA